jgi:hypothetical protein
VAEQAGFDAEDYKHRHVVERGIKMLKQNWTVAI